LPRQIDDQVSDEEIQDIVIRQSHARPLAPVLHFKASDVIFREGDPAAELLVVKSGTVEIRIRNRLIDTLGERSIFGEMALIDGRPRSATALALTDTELIPLGEKGFSLLVAYNPKFALSVLRVLAKHLRAIDAIID
jgi:CRP/FNR family transcriptional regulator, cyclic AMP receptor protein